MDVFHRLLRILETPPRFINTLSQYIIGYPLSSGALSYIYLFFVSGQVSSCTREKQTTNSMPQMVSIYPQLLSLQGTLSELIRERHFLRKDVAALKKENAEMITKAQIDTFEFRKRYQKQMVTSYEKERKLRNVGFYRSFLQFYVLIKTLPGFQTNTHKIISTD